MGPDGTRTVVNGGGGESCKNTTIRRISVRINDSKRQ
jgi:hypothetical protein